MHIFYSTNISKDQITLNEQESQHCIKVLRLKEGDSVFVSNGNEKLFQAHISLPHAKSCLLTIDKEIESVGAPNPKISIAIAPTKSIDRLEWFLEKACEIGITEIFPILCQRNERKQIKEERLNQILISAMKQSISSYLPILHPLTPFKQFLSDLDPSYQTYIAHCIPENRESSFKVINSEQNVCILIGPEGDFTPEEIEFAMDKGVKAIELGKRRLRTETAALYALQMVALIRDLK